MRLFHQASLFKYWTAMMILMPLLAKAADTLHLEGIASYTVYNRDGTIAVSFDGRFSLLTDFSLWEVQYFSDTDTTEQEATFDGNVTYTLYKNLPLANSFQGDTSSPMPFADEIIVTNGQRYLNADSAMVNTSRQPVSLFASAQVAWMNLVACGLISNPPPQLLPPWPTGASAEASPYKSRLVESMPDRDCCADIEFVTSQKLWAAVNKGGTQARRTAVPKEDFVEARFRVLSRTNVQNKCVPLEAEFVRFWFPNIQEKTGKPVRSVIRTTFNTHYFSSETISPPMLRKKTYVTDTRFKTPDEAKFPVFYALTSQAWVDERDPRLARWVEKSLTNHLRMQELIKTEEPNAASNQTLILMVMAVLILAGPVLIFLLRKP